MAAALLGADTGDGFIAASRIPPGERLEVYRNNVRGALMDTLRNLYPSVERLVGTECFDAIASQYIEQAPSHSGDLNEYGEELPDFLSGRAELAELPYLADMARVDWDAHVACLADRTTPFDFAALAQLSPEDHTRLCFQAHPTVRLRASNYPLYQIWRLCHEDGNEVSLEAAGEWIGCARPGISLELRPLQEAEYLLLRGACKRQLFTEVCAEIEQRLPGTDPGPLITSLVTSGWISGFETGTPMSHTEHTQ